MSPCMTATADHGKSTGSGSAAQRPILRSLGVLSHFRGFRKESALCLPQVGISLGFGVRTCWRLRSSLAPIRL
jgi:hypothetical protein